MKVVVQRAKNASVSIDGEKISEIKNGLMILLGVKVGDTEADAEWLARKCASLRIFNDAGGVMNRSVTDVDGDVMVVSQFTLLASTKKGNRPSYIHAAGHELAVPLYELFCRLMEQYTGKPVARGRFGADMQVALVNDGPVTIVMDSQNPE